jgi:hypothetical protein
MTLYCFDTSAWIDGWVRNYPPDTFSSLWKNLEQLINNENIICPDEVLRELEKKEDELYKWAKQREKLFYPLDDQLQIAVQDILSVFPKLVDSSKFRSQTDPFVIGLAKITGRTLVTGEKHRGSQDRPRIPDVCDYYNIPCINLLQLIRDQKWSF